MATGEHFFLALRPPERIGAQFHELARAQQAQTGAEASLLPASFYHLTLMKLAPETARSETLISSVEKAADEIPPFRLQLNRMRSAPVADWHCWLLMPTSIPQVLRDLYLQTRVKLLAAGKDLLQDSTMSFSPRLTLSYRASKPLQDSEVAAQPWMVEAVDLVCAHADAGGRRHEIVNSWPLTGSLVAQKIF